MTLLLSWPMWPRHHGQLLPPSGEAGKCSTGHQPLCVQHSSAPEVCGSCMVGVVGDASRAEGEGKHAGCRVLDAHSCLDSACSNRETKPRQTLSPEAWRHGVPPLGLRNQCCQSGLAREHHISMDVLQGTRSCLISGRGGTEMPIALCPPCLGCQKGVGSTIPQWKGGG